MSKKADIERAVICAALDRAHRHISDDRNSLYESVTTGAGEYDDPGDRELVEHIDELLSEIDHARTIARRVAAPATCKCPKPPPHPGARGLFRVRDDCPEHSIG